MALKLHGTPKGGRLMLSQTQADLKTRWLAEREDKPVSVEFKCHGASKTHSQVKTHFGLSVMLIHEAMKDQRVGHIQNHPEQRHDPRNIN